VENRQPWRERIDQHDVTPDVAVAAALPFSPQRMIAAAGIKRIAGRNAYHHRA
jgi:peroxiredoxin